MSTLTLDVPPSVAARWNALSDEERQRSAQALIETIQSLGDEAAERADIRAVVAEAIAEDDAGLSIPFEQYLDERRAEWRKKGLDFDAAFAHGGVVMEG